VSSVYSTQFALDTYNTGGSFVDVFTVPANTVAVIRCITVRAASGTSSAVAVALNGFHLVFTSTASGDSPPPWDGRVVANAGDILSIATASQPYDVSVSGYLLSA
jgi:hypothetical protein